MKCISRFFLFSLVPLIGFTCGLQNDPEPSETCNKLLGILTTDIQTFIKCSMTHAVPVTYCLNCDKAYDELMRAYTTLNLMVDEKNVSCKSLFFDQDRLGLIQKSYMAGVSLWTGGYCDDCYETPMTVSNKTVEFLNLTEQFQQCTKTASADNICVKCAELYDSVNKNYEAIRKLANDEVCFDLQDKINGTRRFWSIDVQCNTNPDDRQITFLILTAAISSLPICFYVMMFVHTHHSESNEENMNFLNESTTEPGEEEEPKNKFPGSSIDLNSPSSSSSTAVS